MRLKWLIRNARPCTASFLSRLRYRGEIPTATRPGFGDMMRPALIAAPPTA